MYDPNAGRWLSMDPTKFQASDANLYRYVVNEPTSRADPTGLWPMDGPWILPGEYEDLQADPRVRFQENLYRRRIRGCIGLAMNTMGTPFGYWIPEAVPGVCAFSFWDEAWNYHMQNPDGSFIFAKEYGADVTEQHRPGVSWGAYNYCTLIEHDGPMYWQGSGNGTVNTNQREPATYKWYWKNEPPFYGMPKAWSGVNPGQKVFVTFYVYWPEHHPGSGKFLLM